MIILTEKKIFHKSQHPFVTKTLLNRKRRELIQLKVFTKKYPTAYAILRG